MRVSVADDNSRLPVLQPRDDAALDGRGLAIIATVAADWGSHPTQLGKVVWFELDTRLPVPRT